MCLLTQLRLVLVVWTTCVYVVSLQRLSTLTLPVHHVAAFCWDHSLNLGGDLCGKIYWASVPVIAGIELQPVVSALDAKFTINPRVATQQYKWNYGDGTAQSTTTESTSLHLYPLPGTYTVHSTVVTQHGRHSQSSAVVSVLDTVRVDNVSAQQYASTDHTLDIGVVLQQGSQLTVQWERIDQHGNPQTGEIVQHLNCKALVTRTAVHYICTVFAFWRCLCTCCVGLLIRFWADYLLYLVICIDLFIVFTPVSVMTYTCISIDAMWKQMVCSFRYKWFLSLYDNLRFADPCRYQVHPGLDSGGFTMSVHAPREADTNCGLSCVW